MVDLAAVEPPAKLAPRRTERGQLIPVTVVVPILNEEANLISCLESLRRFSEVLVVDSGSTDRSAAVAEQFGVPVIRFSWNGRYPKKRNWVLLNHKFATDWVLFLDADESVDDSFCDELARKIPSGEYCGFWVTYANHFLGRELRHGVPQRKLSLFKIGSGLYEKIEEERWSSLDMEVHEHPVVNGRIGEVSARLKHDDRSGLDKFIERHRNYAIWEANRLLRLEATPEAREKLTKRQSLKYGKLTRWWFPWAYFIYAYVIRLGFLDGGAGFTYAFYKLWYFETVRQLVKEKAAGR